MNEVFDVAVIGAGVVGAAITRALARHELSVVLVEREPDVGMGTSKANTAIWHTGFDATPGTLESRLLQRSYPLMQRYMDDVGVPYERLGAVLVAWTQEQRDALPAIREKAARNGVTDLSMLEPIEVYRREPELGAGVMGGLFVPGESIVCPYTPPLAFATEAVLLGARLMLDTEVRSASSGDGHTVLQTNRGGIAARWIVNAAGLFSDTVDAAFGFSRLRIVPRRGELIVFDKLARPLVRHVVLPVPTKTTKGVLVSPTVFGNVLLGPTAEDRDDKADTSTSVGGLASLLERGRAIMPRLLAEEVTATYSGLRAAHAAGDYAIDADRTRRYVLVGGVRSTGLSAALGIAEHVVELLDGIGVPMRPRASLPVVRMPPIGESQLRPYHNASMIDAREDYGEIVCHCERVTRGELRDACSSVIPASTLDGLRRRTRCLQGRCQGFFCLARVAAELAKARGIAIEEALGTRGARSS